MRYFVSFLFFVGLFAGCEPAEERIDRDFSGTLSFSYDTIFFDTLFATRGSITKRFYATNTHRNTVVIDKIAVAPGSPYTIAVNGKYAQSHEDVKILGRDSILILVEALIDPSDQGLPFLVKDSVVFSFSDKLQDVKLVAWGQDAHFLGDEVITCNTTWTAEKPYVLYKPVLIDSLCELTVEAGTRVFCAPGTFIYVRGSLKINGSASQRVVIRNDRLEPRYENALGQWGGIVFLEGTYDNRIAYATLRNGETALRIGAPDNDTIPDVVLKNVVIENMSSAGILSFTSDVYADNTLINNCREALVANIGGGHYTYLNCTFASYSFDYFRESPATAFTDYIVLDDNSMIKENLSLTLVNTIIYGDQDNEVFFDFTGDTQVSLLVRNNLLKTDIDDLDINFNIINQDPKFKSPFNYNFRIDSLSPAVNAGAAIGLEVDIDSTQRDAEPDIGAYEFVPQ